MISYKAFWFCKNLSCRNVYQLTEQSRKNFLVQESPKNNKDEINHHYIKRVDFCLMGAIEEVIRKVR
jgi:hypothetical protein